MSLPKAITAALRIGARTLLAVVLAVAALLIILYSQWGQDALRTRLLAMLNSADGVEARIDRLRLRFPLTLEIDTLSLTQQGDTLVAASKVRAGVSLLPLLAGHVDVGEALLTDARMRMGAPDSALFMTIRADSLRLKDARVRLSDMDISVDDALISRGAMRLATGADTTTAAPADTAAASPMAIHMHRLRLQRFTYSMRLMPVAEDITATFADAVLSDGDIDLGAQRIAINSLAARGLDARYIAPDSASLAAWPVAAAPDTTASKPWVIDIDTIAFTDSRALYTTQGTVPCPGFDPAYIEATGMDLAVHGFHNEAEVLELPLRLHATERCGLTLDAAGTFATDAAGLYLRDFTVDTELTSLQLDAMMGSGDMTTDPSTPLRLAVKGQAGFPDLATMFPGYALYVRGFGDNPLRLELDASGTAGRLNIPTLTADISRAVRLEAAGTLTDLFGDLGADISITGRVFSLKDFLAALTGPESAVAIPPMTMDGHLRMARGDIDGRLKAQTGEGRLALNATLAGATDAYSLDIDADRFPVNAFMPDLGVGRATLTLQARGNGFDMLSRRTALDASMRMKSLVYDGVEYRDLDLDAALHGGDASVKAHIDNPGFSLLLVADGNLAGDTYRWKANVSGSDIDLLALKLSETEASVSADLTADASYTPATGEIKAMVSVPSLVYNDENDTYDLSDIYLNFFSCDSLTDLRLTNRDLRLTAVTHNPLDSIAARLDATLAVLDRQIARHELLVDSIQEALPKFDIELTAGPSNLITEFLRPSDIGLQSLRLSAVNAADLSISGATTGLSSGDMRLDSIGLALTQDGNRMNVKAVMENRPGTLDEFAHVSLSGVFNSNKAAMRLTQKDIAGDTGYDLGFNAALSDSLVTARLFPLSPVIGYRQWKVNFDNYLQYNYFTHHIDANLRMHGDNSEIALFTSHDHSHDHDADHDADHDHDSDYDHDADHDSDYNHDYDYDYDYDHDADHDYDYDHDADYDYDHDADYDHDSDYGHYADNDINLRISDLRLQELISFNPFAPPISGNLSADLKLNWDGGSNINGSGTVGLEDFYYNKQRVASLLADLDVSTTLEGRIHATAGLDIDGQRTFELSGNLNDTISDSPFNLDLKVMRFPLAMANPFLGADVATLGGTLWGNLDITGDTDHPRMNGEVFFQDAVVRAAFTGTDYKFSEVHVPMVDNIVSFNNLAITAANSNPLLINGRVDLSSLSQPAFDLTLKATDLMAVNSKRPAKNAQIYGKLLLNIDASARGNLSFANVKASIGVQPGTNITYILDTSPTEYAAASMADMVKFVNLNDTSAVASADSIAESSMMLVMNASLNIQSGTSVTIDLPTSTRDKVVLQPQGSLSYTQLPMADGRMTGRLNIDGGSVHYTLPVIGSEKNFTFQSGSYVAFNGDILNPVLNIHANDQIKANVTQSGQNSRLIDFDVILAVTGTLETMDVAFDLSTDDDLTVANELQAMTPTQRANQAMNMLLYGMYTGPGTSADASMSFNPLYSFLESQINNWAARNIRGVDLTFGIDQYDQTTNGASSTTTNYSYRVSKTLFNDRFKIVVGGNYSTNDDADENISENLINDISFEYFLNDRQTMLLKVFRHTGYESILEGEVTQTGVGFVYKRKLNRLSQMLPKFLRPKRRRPVADSVPTHVGMHPGASDTTVADSVPVVDTPASAPEIQKK